MGFTNPGSGQPVIRIELVINLDIELLAPVGIEILSCSACGTRDRPADPTMSRRVQAVTAVESVRARHVADQLGYISGPIYLPAKWIARVQRVAKHAETLYRASRPRYLGPVQRVACPIHYRSDSAGAGAAGRDFRVAVVHSRKETKDALPRGIGEDRGVDVLLLGSGLAVEHPEEKRLVADDRPAETGRILRPVVPERADALPVVQP